MQPIESIFYMNQCWQLTYHWYTSTVPKCSSLIPHQSLQIPTVITTFLRSEWKLNPYFSHNFDTPDYNFEKYPQRFFQNFINAFHHAKTVPHNTQSNLLNSVFYKMKDCDPRLNSNGTDRPPSSRSYRSISLISFLGKIFEKTLPQSAGALPIFRNPFLNLW